MVQRNKKGFHTPLCCLQETVLFFLLFFFSHTYCSCEETLIYTEYIRTKDRTESTLEEAEKFYFTIHSVYTALA